MNCRKLIIVSFFFAYSSWATAGATQVPLIKDQKENLYSSTVEFSRGNKKLLFAGMVHTAPQGFYKSMAQTIGDWVAEEDTPAVALEEFMTCTTSALSTEKVDFSEAEVALLKSVKVDWEDSEAFFTRDEKALAPLIEALALKKEPCVIDVDGRATRPFYLVKRNRIWCDEEHARGASCQWQDFHLPLSSKLSAEPGDLIIDQFPAGMQFAAFGLYEFINGGKGLENYNSEILRPSDYLILDYRNYLLLNKVRSLFYENGVNRIVLPWGALHIFGVKEMLLSMGFTQGEIKKVYLMTKAEAVADGFLPEEIAKFPVDFSFR